MFNRFCFGALLLAGLAGLLSGCSTTSSAGLTTIVISPSGASAVTMTLAPPGVAQGHAQFTALGYYGHAGHQVTQDITDSVTWSSSLTQVVTICSNGSPAPCTPAMDGLATVTGFTPQGAWTGLSSITASCPTISTTGAGWGFPKRTSRRRPTGWWTACLPGERMKGLPPASMSTSRRGQPKSACK